MSIRILHFVLFNHFFHHGLCLRSNQNTPVMLPLPEPALELTPYVKAELYLYLEHAVP